MVAAEGLRISGRRSLLGKSILVSIPPEIIKLTDHDGDGFCEEKETWFDGQTITGCANDLHGPYLDEMEKSIGAKERSLNSIIYSRTGKNCHRPQLICIGATKMALNLKLS